MNPNDVASPCINICKIDEPTQRCTGCYRTIEEITLWSTMGNDAKQAVVDAVIKRRVLAKVQNEQSKITPPINDSNSDASASGYANNRTTGGEQQ